MDANVFTATQLDPAKLSLPRLVPPLQKFPATRIKLCACISTRGKPCSFATSAPEGSESWKTWLWREAEGKTRVLYPQKVSLFEDVSDTARVAATVLYRGLLLGAIGSGMAMPAVAGPSSVSEVVMKKVIEKTANNKIEIDAKEFSQDNLTVEKESSTADAEQGTESGDMSKRHLILGEKFWKDIKVSKSSIESILKNILEKDPGNLDALECLATAMIERGDGANALTVIEKLEVLKPDDIEWKYLKGQAYDMMGEYLLAKDIFRRILKIDPFSSRAIQGLMMAMDELDQPEELMEIVEDTMLKARYEKNITEARNMGMLIGQYLMMKGHWHEALEHYQEMAEEDKKDFRPPLCQGLVYSAIGERAKAERYFKTYQKLIPKDYPERKLLDALMSQARQQGQKVYDQKQKDKYFWNWKQGPLTSSDK